MLRESNDAEATIVKCPDCGTPNTMKLNHTLKCRVCGEDLTSATQLNESANGNNGPTMYLKG